MKNSAKNSIYLQIQKQIQNSANKFAAILTVFAAVVLVGCSGFVPSSPVSPPPPPEFNTPTDSQSFSTENRLGENPVNVINPLNVINGTLTAFRVENSGDSPLWNEVDITDSDVTATPITVNGTRIWDIRKNTNVLLTLPGNLQILAYSLPITTTAEDDYFIAGSWLFTDTLTSFRRGVGVFFDSVGTAEVNPSSLNNYLGNNGNIASYSGKVFGIERLGGSDRPFESDININLTLNLTGTTYQIGGSVDEARDRNNNLVFSRVMLANATIQTDYSFQGTVTPIAAGSKFTRGNWKGRLYGAAGSAVGGTFLLDQSNNRHFAGTFGAELRTNPPTPFDYTTVWQTKNPNDLVNVVTASIDSTGDLTALRVVNTGSGANWTEFDFTDTVATVGLLTLDGEPSLRFSKRISDFNLNAVVISSGISSTTDETDYLIAGAWSENLPSGGSTIAGGFADSIGVLPLNFDSVNTYLLANDSKASYLGNAVKFVINNGAAGGSISPVYLTLNLGTGSTRSFDIEGSIGFGGGLPVLNLDNATIGSDGSFGSTFSGGTTGSYTGTWKGQLYGAEGNAVGGTFEGSNPTDGLVTPFAGGFVADRQ